MTGRRFRRLGSGLWAGAGAGLVALTSMTAPAFAYGDDTAFVMGGTGSPIVSPSYMGDVFDKFVAPNGYSGYTPEGLDTPAALYPLTGVNSSPFDTSVSQGVTILNDAILQNFAESNDTVVLGYSQSATIASLEMRQLAALPPADRPNPGQLAFVLLGDPNNPDGGVLERFVGLAIPSFGVTFSGATPADLYPTDIYTLEYDAAADFPRYPIDFPADLNAFGGFIYLHPAYPDLTSAQIDSAIALPTVGDTMTHYYMIPVNDLPLLDPLRQIPVVGNPLADLIQPDLTVLVNLGYGSITDGWSQGPANVPTPFGLFPTNISPTAVLEALGTGAWQGVQDAVAAVGPSSLTELSLSNLESLLTSNLVTALAGLGVISGSEVATGVVDTLTGVASTDIAVLLPTADLALAAATTLPAYDAGLFVDGLEAGNLLDAVGLPIAADLGLGTLGGLVELGTLAEAAITTISGLASLIP